MLVGIVNVQDNRNLDKIWVIRKTSCSHFYVNQMIKGRYFYPRYTRMRLKDLKEILGSDFVRAFDGR